MTVLPRRSLRELEVELRQRKVEHIVFVEGPSDARFYRWATGAITGTDFRSVSLIDFSGEVLNDDESISSNRTLVVAAMRRFDTKQSGVKATGIVDRDCGVPEEWRKVADLLSTDFPAIESYCCTPSVLLKFFQLDLDLAWTEDRIIKAIGGALKSLFEMRARHGGLSGLEHDKILSNKSGVIHVAIPVTGVDGAFDAPTTWAELQETCYGHDLAPVLLAIDRNKIKNRLGIKSAEHLESRLVGYVDREHLNTYPLFRSLDARLSHLPIAAG